MTCPPQVERAASAHEQTTAVWTAVSRRLGEELPPLARETWIEPLAVLCDGTRLRLLCPTDFHRERVRERYLERIERYAAETAGERIAVTLEVGSGGPPDATASAATRVPMEAGAADEAPPQAGGPPSARAARVVALATPPRGGAHSTLRSPSRGGVESAPAPTLDFDSFVVGPANALAREACLAFARGSQVALNPLFLAAAPGLGKTHLARAAMRELLGRGARVVMVSAEEFTNELMAAIRGQSTESFKRRYRDQLDVLIVDDLHFLRGKRQTQLELVHTLETLLRRGARILATADHLPLEIPELDPRLASLLTSGLCAEIEPPDDALRLAIARAKAAAFRAKIPDDCLRQIAAGARGSVRELEAVVVQVVASASLLSRRVDRELVEAALRKVAKRPAGSALDPERIAELVAAHFGTTAAALASRTRRREVLMPRQIAMYLAARYSDASQPRIGEAFGRQHPAVANAVRAVERARAQRPTLDARISAIVREIEALAGPRKGPRRAGP